MARNNQFLVNEIPQSVDCHTLNRIARLAVGLNGLAKQLTGLNQRTAYKLKADACSMALLLDGAIVDGLGSNNIVGISFLTNPQSRIHIKVSDLNAEAQAIVRRQAKSVAAVAPMSEVLNSDQLRLLKNYSSFQTNRSVSYQALHP